MALSEKVIAKKFLALSKSPRLLLAYYIEDCC